MTFANVNPVEIYITAQERLVTATNALRLKTTRAKLQPLKNF